jgi:hypothetical protein
MYLALITAIHVKTDLHNPVLKKPPVHLPELNAPIRNEEVDAMLIQKPVVIYYKRIKGRDDKFPRWKSEESHEEPRW